MLSNKIDDLMLNKYFLFVKNNILYEYDKLLFLKFFIKKV